MLGAAPGLGVQGGQFAGGVLLNAGILRAMHAESFPRALFVTAMVMVLAFVFAFVLMFFVVCAGGTAAVLSGGSGSA